jgi:drug/metabolite transporter (DMT)-like permease
VGLFLVFLSAAGFATLAIFGKYAYAEGLTLSSVLAWRFIVAAAVLIPVIVVRKSWSIKPSLLATGFLLGAIGYAVQATLFFAALERTSAAVTSLLLYTYPAFVALIGRFVFNEVLGNWRLFALVTSIAGVVLTIPYDGSGVELVGAAIALSSGIWYACYLSFGARRAQGMDPVTTTGLLSLGAAVSFAIAAAVSGGLQMPVGWPLWSSIAGIGIVATVLPVVTLFAAIRRLGITRTSIMSTLEPVLTALFGFLLLGESLSLVQVCGGGLVVVGAVVLQLFG